MLTATQHYVQYPKLKAPFTACWLLLNPHNLPLLHDNFAYTVAVRIICSIYGKYIYMRHDTSRHSRPRPFRL